MAQVLKDCRFVQEWRPQQIQIKRSLFDVTRSLQETQNLITGSAGKLSQLLM